MRSLLLVVLGVFLMVSCKNSTGNQNANNHKKQIKKEVVTKAKQDNSLINRVSIGIIPDLRYDKAGVKVEIVKKDSPAERAGFQKNDIITKIDGKTVVNVESYAGELVEHKAGDSVVFSVKRNGKDLEFNLKID